MIANKKKSDDFQTYQVQGAITTPQKTGNQKLRDDPGLLPQLVYHTADALNITWQTMTGSPNISHIGGGPVAKREMADAFVFTATLPLAGVGKTGDVASASSKLFEQYSLRAATSDFYPAVKWGTSSREIVWMEEGEVWKFGTTTRPLTRYSADFLKNTGGGLKYSPEFTGTTDAQVKTLEKMKITNYKLQNQALPPGNKMIR
jgi:hypothetical protein